MSRRDFYIERKPAAQSARNIVVEQSDVRTNGAEAGPKNGLAHPRPDSVDLVARRGQAPARDAQVSKAFFPDTRSIEPKLDPRISTRIGDEIFCVLGRRDYFVRRARHLMGGERLPASIGFLQLDHDLRRPARERNGEGKATADLVRRKSSFPSHILALDLIITLPPAPTNPGSQIAGTSAIACQNPAGQIESANRCSPIDGMIKPPDVAFLGPGDLFLQRALATGAAWEETEEQFHHSTAGLRASNSKPAATRF